jgi:hypothetical protein
MSCCARERYNKLVDTNFPKREFTAMNAITPDAATLSIFDKLDQITEIRDSQGKVVGVYAPIDRAKQLLFLEATIHIDPREKDRRKASGGPKYTTQEVLDYLASLETR